MLADLAVNDAPAFAQLVEKAARGSVRQPGLRAEAVRNCKYTPLTK